MNRIIINTLAILFLLASCGSLETTVKHPCTGNKYQSSKNFFRASGLGESKDRSTAKKKALSNAKAELASAINVTMKNVEDNFVNSLEENNVETIREKFTGNIRTVLDQRISGSIITCEEYKFNKTTQKYVTYVAVELSAKGLANQIANQISRDDQIKIEFDYQKFQETFNQEMNKLENKE